ncbi:MAG: hypothetical protein ACRCYE_01825, partial [Sarcina sp.]
MSKVHAHHMIVLHRDEPCTFLIYFLLLFTYFVDDKAKQYEEIQSLKSEINDLNKRMRLMKVMLLFKMSFKNEPLVG